MSLLPILIFGQQKIISGRVTDERGNPLAAVSVYLKGTILGTSTNENGIYRIAAKKGQTLVFSAVGMEPRQEIVDTAHTINVMLKSQVNKLEEVVVTAMGTQRLSRSLSGSVAGIMVSSSKKLKTFISKNIKRRCGELLQRSP